ncbi:hypothetical protein FZ928_07870 [Klebsiella pneumoniae]|uniref:Uncharacterized protein n=1 Tax=Klebsiella pneumoniae TaxID=573 RepID=A0A5C2LJZ7_KLEPN|nr:hypothetical protein FZ928_07870 [Klebsiella pneumoniae]
MTIRLVCLSRVLRSVTSPGDKMPSAVIYFQFRRWDAAKTSMNIKFMSPQRDLTLKNVAKAKD